MRRPLLITALAAFLGAVATPAAAQMAPGTVKLLSKNKTLTDAATGDAFIELKDDASAKFLVIGPETLQADLRINLAPADTRGKPILLVVLAGGKELARFRIQPVAGTDKWKDRSDIKPGRSIGFYVEFEAGPKAYEFKVSGATRGAGLLLVPKSKATRPLGPNAKTIAPRPTVVATPTPAVAAATPTPTAAPVNTPVPLDSIGKGGITADDVRRKRRTYQTVFKAGYAAPAYEDFSATIAMGGEARWAFGSRKSVAASVEVMSFGFSALVPDDPGRAEPPAAVDVTLMPVSFGAHYLAPFESKIQPYAGAAATLAYGQSTFRQFDRTSVPESLVGFGGQLVGGVEYDLSGTDLQEGSRKVFVEAKGSYLTVPFEAHDYTDWSTLQVLGGISLKF